MIPNVLTIAGSDPSGGAGIQADLKAMSALGGYGMAVLTALTAQSTRGVTGVHPVPAEFVGAQLDTLFDDVRVDAVKLGMLANEDIIVTVAARVAARPVPHVVLDPVMVAKSGHRLLDARAEGALVRELLSKATLLTPNLPEAAVLLGAAEPTSVGEMHAMAKELGRRTGGAVLVKGGHLGGALATDVLFDRGEIVELSAPRHATKSTHGTGCTLSAAIATRLAHGDPLREAVTRAKEYLTGAIRAASALSVGSGHGPVHHFHALWPPA